MTPRYSIWFTDGEFAYGWLQEEHGNGRMSRWEAVGEGAKEEAEEKAALEERHDREGYCFTALDIDASSDEQFKVTEEVRERALARQRARWA